MARNAAFRVEADARRGLRFVCASAACADPAQGGPWVGPGTDGQGWFALDPEVRPRFCGGRGVVFTALGEAAPAGTLRLDGPGARRLDVRVSPAGRVRVEAPGPCP